MCRNREKSRVADLAAYHAFLQTRTAVTTADAFTMPRIAELSQRSHQFNLSAAAYSAGELKVLAARPSTDVLCLQAADIFGDLGLVAACVAEYGVDRAVLRAFWLSCRAFGRGFEDELLNEIKIRAARRGCSTVIGLYVPTAKNQRFSDFYAQNGIASISDIGELERE